MLRSIFCGLLLISSCAATAQSSCEFEPSRVEAFANAAATHADYRLRHADGRTTVQWEGKLTHSERVEYFRKYPHQIWFHFIRIHAGAGTRLDMSTFPPNNEQSLQGLSRQLAHEFAKCIKAGGQVRDDYQKKLDSEYNEVALRLQRIAGARVFAPIEY